MFIIKLTKDDFYYIVTYIVTHIFYTIIAFTAQQTMVYSLHICLWLRLFKSAVFCEHPPLALQYSLARKQSERIF